LDLKEFLFQSISVCVFVETRQVRKFVEERSVEELVAGDVVGGVYKGEEFIVTNAFNYDIHGPSSEQSSLITCIANGVLHSVTQTQLSGRSRCKSVSRVHNRAILVG